MTKWWSVDVVKPPLTKDESGRVLVWDGDSVRIAIYYGMGGWSSGGSFNFDVTHWADLPAPPKEVSRIDVIGQNGGDGLHYD